MSCDQAKKLLSMYTDDRLTDEESRAIAEHVAVCQSCAAQLREIEEAKDILKAKEKYKAPADMDLSFMKRLKASPKPVPAMIMSRFSARRYAMAASFIMAFFMAAYYIGAPSSFVLNPKGMVKIYLSAKNEWVVLDNKMSVGKNDIVKTFQNSEADIDIPRVSTVRLKSNTEVRVAGLGSRFAGGGVRYFVEKGKVLVYHTEGVNKKSEFVIETPESVNSALGTDFMVNTIPESGKTWLGVLDGAVLVKSVGVPFETVMVNAGQKTEVYANNAPLSPSALAESEWGEIQELYQIGVKPQVALLISFSELRTRELLKPCSLYVADRKGSPILDILKETVRAFNRAIKDNSKEKHIEAINKLEEMISEYPNKKYDVQILLYIGAYYHYIGQYSAAIDTFEKVMAVYPDSGLASIAQCAVGIIYEEDLHDAEKARSAYQRVLNSYPKSPEASEAEKGLVRIASL